MKSCGAHSRKVPSQRRPRYRGKVAVVAALALFLLAMAWLTSGWSLSPAAMAAEPVSTPKPEPLTLGILDVHLRGEVAEIRGKTAPDAAVFINGEKVPLVEPDGRFTFFLVVPADADFRLCVTAQDYHGATATVRQVLRRHLP